MERELMKPGEAAERLGVSIPTLHAWAAKGRIGYWRTLGGHRRFDRAEVERLRHSMRVEQAALANPAVMAAVEHAKTGDRSQLRRREVNNGG